MRLPLILAPLLFTAAPALASTGNGLPDLAAGHTLLTLSAEGQTARAPDMAVFSAGVSATGRDAATAMAADAAAMNRVVDALKGAGIEPRDIQTSGLSLSPTYVDRKPGDNRPPAISGYTVSNSVTVRERRIGEVGRVLDALVSAGANDLSGPNFTLADPDAALDEARADAIRKVTARAQLYARAEGLRVVQVREISEFAPSPVRPMERRMMVMDAAPMAAPTPVEGGEVTRTLNVSMVFDLAP